MQKAVKQNGTVKKGNVTVKKEVQKKLTQAANGKTTIPKKTVIAEKPTVNLDDRIQKLRFSISYFGVLFS